LLGDSRNRVLAHFARELNAAAGRLASQPSPRAMTSLLATFLSLLDTYRDTILHDRGAIFWRLAAQYSDVAGNFSRPAPAENQNFVRLPRMLASLPWVTDFLVRLSRLANLTPAQEEELACFSPALAARLLRRAHQTPEGAFLERALSIQRGLENRLRQVWLLEQFEQGEPSPLDLYASAHSSLFAVFQPSLPVQRLEQDIRKLGGLAAALDLPEIAGCFESPEWLAHYAILHFTPPDPGCWRPRGMDQFERLLYGRVSRWFTYPFLHRLEPMEIAATVLRLGRPPFYERPAAHALLEYALLEGVTFDASRFGFYYDTMRVLNYQFQLFFEGYLLRVAFYPRLKEPRGWCEYLDALQRMHAGEVPLPELQPYRREFLRARGLACAEDLLCRLSGSPGMVQ
jgi:hypothetical protein